MEGSQREIGPLIINVNLTIAPLCSGSTKRPFTHQNKIQEEPSGVAVIADLNLEMLH